MGRINNSSDKIKIICRKRRSFTKQKRLICNAFIIITCVSLLLIGCKETEGTTPEASSSEVESEVISEEVSEEVSEEESEDVASEEVAEEESNEVEYVNFSDHDELLEYLQKYDRTIIVQYNFG